uniref:Uncharacterized protein n=1 Tax=Octopus bimaculoides TaxID=37653 RepID=A0A0L8I4Y0_OCTBM
MNNTTHYLFFYGFKQTHAGELKTTHNVTLMIKLSATCEHVLLPK